MSPGKSLRVVGCLLVLAMVPMLTSCGFGAAAPGEELQPVKQRRTFYTEERLEALRGELESAVARADRYMAGQTPEALWRFVPGQSLPRSFAIHSRASSQSYPSPEEWKVEVEIEGQKRLMPSNDFQAYYESGIDRNGWFDPARADRRLLVNVLYPDKPRDWGVDDGWGWVDENGRHWTFIAHYMHWHRFIGVRHRIVAFRDAYLHTGDPRYARAGLILMDRLADVYPDLAISAHDTDTFRNSDGGTKSGKMVGRFWEANHIRDIISAYDAFFPMIRDGDDYLVQILSRKASKYRVPASKSSTGAIGRNIEERILREILPSVKAAKVRGDHGNPSALAIAAVVLDEPEGYTREVLEFMMRSGGLQNIGGRWQTTGGHILPGLVNRTDRDGHPETGAPQYNRIYVGRMSRAADILAHYDAPAELNLAKHPKYLKMVESRSHLWMLDRYIPTIGDTWLTGDPQGRYLGPLESRNLAGYGFAALREGDRDPHRWPDLRRAMWLYYGRNAMRDRDNRVIAGGHAHRNALMLGYYGFGIDMLPDLGYPEQTGLYPKRVNWTANTISHNTVVVNARRQDGHWVGIPHHFEAAGPVQFIDVEAPIVYPETELYRRSSAMIRVDDENSYLVDFFRVAGGEDHLFSFHAAEGPVVTEGLSLTAQARGTYAGEEIPMPGQGEDSEYNRTVRNGFNYLYDVRRAAAPPGGFSVEWQLGDTWNVLPDEMKGGIRLRLTMLNNDLQELALAHGDPPQHRRNPRRLNYMLARRQGADLQTVFVSVIEPYFNDRFVTGIEPVPVHAADGSRLPEIEARAVRVTLRDGTVDTVVHSLNPERALTVGNRFTFRGTLGFFRERADGSPQHVYLHGGTLLERREGGEGARAQDGVLAARVVDFTREMSTENHLLIELAEAERHLANLAGRWIYIETDGWRNGAYEIVRAEPAGPGQVKLDLGNITLIREFQDDADFSKGYLYNIAPGARARIPLSVQASF